MTKTIHLIFIIAVICILLLCGAGCLSPGNANTDDLNNSSSNNPNAGSNNSPSETSTVYIRSPSDPAIYAAYPYDEMTERSDLVVMGHFISFEEAKWSTHDGKLPSGVKITPFTDEDGNEYFEVVLNVGDDMIYTDSTFKINEYFKGETDSDKIIIRFFSGTVDMVPPIPAITTKGLRATDYKENTPIVFYLERSGTTKEGLSYYTIVTPRGALFVDGNILTNFDGEKLTLEEAKSYSK